MAKITMSPVEIHAFEDKVARAFTEEMLDGDAEGADFTISRRNLLAQIKEAVGIALGLDQVAAEVDLLAAASDALEDIDEEADLPPMH